MSDPAHSVQYTYADYLALEASSNVKDEYLAGQIYGMAGGSPEHAALAAAVVGLLFPQLSGTGCRLHSADLRVRVRSTGPATYPDVTIVCGASERDPADPDAVVNPTLLVEVLSPSTEDYGRGDKFAHYKAIPTLRQYVLVCPRERTVEVWSAAPDGDWTVQIAPAGEVAALAAIACRLDVGRLFDAATEPHT